MYQLPHYRRPAGVLMRDQAQAGGGPISTTAAQPSYQEFLTGRRDAAQAVMDTILDQAHSEGRELTPDETRTLDDRRGELTRLEPQITAASQREQRRSAELAALRSAQGRPPAGNLAAPSMTTTRPELVYGPSASSTFLRDVFHAAQGNRDAAERLDRHYAMLADLVTSAKLEGRDVLSAGVGGTIPTEYLPGLFVPAIAKARPITAFFRRVPVDDARPRVFAKVTTSTGVTKQASEGTNPADSGFATTPVTTVPEFYGGSVIVARQVLDGADPSAESMILGDLADRYAETTESAMAAAVVAGGTAGPGYTTATPYAGIKGAVPAYRTARRLGAQRGFMPDTAYTNMLGQDGADGRPLVPWLAPTNSSGQVSADGSAVVLGVPIDQAWALAATKSILARSDEAHSYESSLLQYRYEEVVGPAEVKLGVWAYFAAVVRRPAGVVVLTGA